MDYTGIAGVSGVLLIIVGCFFMKKDAPGNLGLGIGTLVLGIILLIIYGVSG